VKLSAYYGGTPVTTGLLESIFAEEPVPLDVFVTDAKYLANPRLSVEQYNAVRHIERIYLPETYALMAGEPELVGGSLGPWAPETHAYWAEPIRMINFATLMIGKGGGKDHLARIAALRIAHLLLCLRKPQDYFGMPAQDTIHQLNVASSKEQAHRAFFEPLTRAVQRGWFQDKCEPLKHTVSWDKNIESISGSSEVESQEGLNLILGTADEVDAFRSAEEARRYQPNRDREPVRSAEGILKMLRTSAATRFPENYKVVRISYPRYLGSMIMQLHAQATKDVEEQGAASRHYVAGPLATWEVNPRFDRVERVPAPGTKMLVPITLLEDYKEDPSMARSMYECAPSRAQDAYFRNVASVLAAVRPGDSRLSFEYVARGRGKAGHRVVVWEPEYMLASDFRPIAGALYAMHADLAKNGDRAGVSMAHVAKWVETDAVSTTEDGELVHFTEMRPIVEVDFALAFSGDKGTEPPREIQMRWARALAFDLRQRGFPVQRFTFDGWQSLDSLQILATQGIETERVSTDMSEEPWKTLRDLLAEARVILPPTFGAEVSSALLTEELLGLRRLFGGKIDHPVSGSKDIADAVACAALGALAIGGSEEEGRPVVYPAAVAFELVPGPAAFGAGSLEFGTAPGMRF
jgi:hypothetical protein